MQQPNQGPGPPQGRGTVLQGPAGTGPGQEAGWESFYRQQRRQRAGRDRLSSAVLVIILSALAFRIQGDVALWELLHHAVLMALAVLSATEGNGLQYVSWRNVVVVALRLGTASSPLVARHAIQMLQDPPPATRAALAASTLRLLLGDHALLLAFLATGWPVGSLSNVLLQLLSLAFVMRHNRDVCTTPFMSGSIAVSGVEGLRSRATHRAGSMLKVLWRAVQGSERVEVCMVYTFIIQALIGLLLPAYFFLCSDSRSAVRYAEEHRIPEDDSTFRLYRTLHSSVCVYGGRLCRLSLLLATLAGLWVAGCTLMSS